MISNGYYSVDNTVYVTVRDLSHLGSMLNTAVSAGANNINSITFDVADKTAAMAAGPPEGHGECQQPGQRTGQNSRCELGRNQDISYSDNSPLPYYGMGGGGASAPNASVPIQPGQTQISVTVSVTYTLK